MQTSKTKYKKENKKIKTKNNKAKVVVGVNLSRKERKNRKKQEKNGDCKYLRWTAIREMDS